MSLILFTVIDRHGNELCYSLNHTLQILMQLSPVIDRTVLKTVKAAFGGRVRFVVSGGAPLGPSVEAFLNITLCCPVLQVCMLTFLLFYYRIYNLWHQSLFLALVCRTTTAVWAQRLAVTRFVPLCVRYRFWLLRDWCESCCCLVHETCVCASVVITTRRATTLIGLSAQGYGLTETCAASFLAGPFPGHSGTVGPPVPGTEYRLEGSSELGYALAAAPC